MNPQKEVGHISNLDPPKKCSALTKSKNVACKNVGKWTHNGQCYCYRHVPKKTDTCVICLTPIIDAHYLACGHYFHKKCINRWVKKQNSCPTCRETVFDINMLKSYNDVFNTIDDSRLSVAIDIAIQSKNREDFIQKLIDLQIN